MRLSLGDPKQTHQRECAPASRRTGAARSLGGCRLIQSRLPDESAKIRGHFGAHGIVICSKGWTNEQTREGRKEGGMRSRPSSQAATRRSRRPTATPPCRPTSRPCRAGNATSGAASTRSSCAPSPACARRSNGTRRFYGVEGQGWFLGIHCFTKYVKVAFFRGTSLRPVPPGESKQQGRALPRHPRGRPARRSSARRLG